MNFKKLLIILEIFVLGFFIYWHFKLGLVRFFDADELAYLRWAHNLVAGLRPYTDFFFFIPPLYLYFLAPLFFIVGKSTAIILSARFLSFVIFLLSAGVLFLLVREIKGVQAGILAILVFSALPIPADKWLEIRPDGVATLFIFAGILFLVKAIKKGQIRNFFLAGFFYSLSVMILPKEIFFVIVGVFILILDAYFFSKSPADVTTKILKFSLAASIPVIFVLITFFLYGDFGKSLYLVTKVASDASRVLGSKFPIPANFFFYPNDVYFGEGGFSLPWIANLVIWLVAIFWTIIKSISCFNEKDKKDTLIYLLLSASLIINLLAYIKFFPLKHEQYLVPISPLIAFFFNDFFLYISNVFRDKNHQALVKLIQPVSLIALIILLFMAGKNMYDRKVAWTNKFDLLRYENLYKVIPENVAVFDLTGETIFTREGYYFCCIPYGQYEEALSFKFPDIRSELEKRGTNYVYLGQTNRLSVIPTLHAKYIMDNFIPMEQDKTLLVRKGK
ncbi:glycosyltransferase family 39 protein [Candidatus Gottesmanbacteria bacterium]|nr:glycosyltransferase family 39 protein [Candidatus Gottesmanbacteria bacterium]